MGIIDFFSGKGAGALKKHASRVADKRAQTPDRWESIQALGKMKSGEAAAALLRRFTFRIDPSITDQEEKDAAFEAIVAVGEPAIEPVRAFLQSSETVSWPLKMLERLLSPEDVVAELLALAEGMGTDYERDPERKIQVVSYLEDRRDPRILDAVSRFCGDSNETVRFHAVGAVFAQEGPEKALDALATLFLKEESVRIRSRVLEGMIAHKISFGERAEAAKAKLPQGYGLDATGVPVKSR